MKTAVIYDKWLAGLGGGEVVACTMARILKDTGFNVTLVSQTKIEPGVILKTLNIDVKDIRLEIIDDNESKLKQLCVGKDLFINISFMDYSYGYAKKNIYYVHFPTVPSKSLLKFRSKNRRLNNFYNKYLLAFPSGIFNYVLTFFKVTQFHRFLSPSLKERIDDRLRAGIYYNLPSRLESYQVFMTHSKYVKKWIKKAWGINAKVLYPPVSLITNHSYLTTKNNWICSVGRYFTLGHGKKQEVMVEAFKKLYSELVTSHYPLVTSLQIHFVGGVGNEPSSLRFIEQLRDQAKGYPIYFHYNVDRKEVEDVLLKSRIYWHATGFGENPDLDPIKFEHFGIAPVEALSAGCIPVLFNGGGLPEILKALNMKPKNHLFDTQKELVEKTKQLILHFKQTNLLISEKLIAHFSQSSFKKNFLTSLHEK